MACVTFLSPAQRAALGAPGRRMSLDEILSAHPVPPVTEGKVARLRAMAADPDPSIRESAALNRHTPPDVLVRLGEDTDPAVRCGVARNQQAPKRLLISLGSDPSPQVRGWVAANPSTPQVLLDALTGDPDPTVRRIVSWARNW